MGLGDDIMSTAQAKALHDELGYKVAFGDGKEIYWSEVFSLCPHVRQPGEKCAAAVLKNHPGNRPYILCATRERIVFNPNHRAVPGAIDVEGRRAVAEPYVIVEPHAKEKFFHRNKTYPYWQEVVDRLEMTVVQFDYGKPLLRGVVPVKCSFLESLPYLKESERFYGTDGGLHHAAAALGVPATVIFGGFSPPEVLGYPFHRNLGGGWCGAKVECLHCESAMRSIAPEEVV